MKMRLALTHILGALILISSLGFPAAGQNGDDILAEMRRREDLRQAQERFDRFVEDTFQFFEISGELVSFRVHPNMTEDEVRAVEERSQELDGHAGRLLDYVRSVAPYVRGETEGLWIVMEPLDSESTLMDRLTLILALVNRMGPKIDQLTRMLGEQLEPTIPVEELQFETSAPFFIVGGLEELRTMTRDLRRAL